MWILKFYDSKQGGLVEIKADTLREVYYELGEHVDDMQPTFREEMKISMLPEFQYEVYKKYVDEGNDDAAEAYFDKYREKMTERDYLYSILEDLSANALDNYRLDKEGNYYLDDIDLFKTLDYKRQQLVLDWLKVNNKLHFEGFSSRHYVKNKQFY